MEDHVIDLDGEAPERQIKGRTEAYDFESFERKTAHPDTRVPPRAEVLEAMQRAFAGEDGIDGRVLERYAHHAELTLAGNRRRNLLSYLEPYDVAVIHYLDAWRVTRRLPLAGRRVLDAGCGPGFPGYPIALAEPSTRVVLCEAIRYFTEFHRECIAAMGTENASSVWDLVEDHLAHDRYDVVILRAIASVRKVLHTLRHVGHSFEELVMLKPPGWDDEVRAAEGELERLGFRLDEVFEHRLPSSAMDACTRPRNWGHRAVLVFRAR